MLSLLTTRRWLGVTAAALLVGAACVRLGIWQLHRGEARSHYNATLHARATGRPVPVDALLRVGVRPDGDVRFRRVTATGSYDAAATLLVRSKVQNGVLGYEVLVPLVTARGSLLVDRGWIALAGRVDRPTPVPRAPTGVVTVTGRLRDGSRAGDSGLRYAADPEPSIAQIDALAVGRRIGRPTYGTYIESTSERPAAPAALAQLPEPDDQNSGLNYAYFVQWEVFAGIAVVGWFLLLRREAAEGGGVSGAAGQSAEDPGTTMGPRASTGAGDAEREDHPWPA